jgi:hypothetical protein
LEIWMLTHSSSHTEWRQHFADADVARRQDQDFIKSLQPDAKAVQNTLFAPIQNRQKNLKECETATSQYRRILTAMQSRRPNDSDAAIQHTITDKFDLPAQTDAEIDIRVGALMKMHKPACATPRQIQLREDCHTYASRLESALGNPRALTAYIHDGDKLMQSVEAQPKLWQKQNVPLISSRVCDRSYAAECSLGLEELSYRFRAAPTVPTQIPSVGIIKALMTEIEGADKAPRPQINALADQAYSVSLGAMVEFDPGWEKMSSAGKSGQFTENLNTHTPPNIAALYALTLLGRSIVLRSRLDEAEASRAELLALTPVQPNAMAAAAKRTKRRPKGKTVSRLPAVAKDADAQMNHLVDSLPVSMELHGDGPSDRGWVLVGRKGTTSQAEPQSATLKAQTNVSNDRGWIVLKPKENTPPAESQAAAADSTWWMMSEQERIAHILRSPNVGWDIEQLAAEHAREDQNRKRVMQKKAEAFRKAIEDGQLTESNRLVIELSPSDVED